MVLGPVRHGPGAGVGHAGTNLGPAFLTLVSVGAVFFRTVVGPTLPLAGLLFLVTLFSTARDLPWPLLVVTTPEHE